MTPEEALIVGLEVMVSKWQREADRLEKPIGVPPANAGKVLRCAALELHEVLRLHAEVAGRVGRDGDVFKEQEGAPS